MSDPSPCLRVSAPSVVVRKWLETKHYTPFEFQEQAWAAYLDGKSGLIHAPTGMGKTLAAWLGPVMRWCERNDDWSATDDPPPLTVLWITPLRALARDTTSALQLPISELSIPWTVQLRTGDVSQTIKRKQKERLPSALVTTPESLSLLLSYEDAPERFQHLECVVCDEWHELMSTKRGSQTELALARLRGWNPALQTWGLSATIGNLEQAMEVLLGASPGAKPTPPRRGPRGEGGQGTLIRATDDKAVVVETVIPPNIERFPWAGHLGLHLLPEVLPLLERAKTTLVFTNTRSQTEMWFQALLQAKPEWIGEIACHHGSIDRQVRDEVESLLREGRLRVVVCTSSLDLGVDFSPVEQVLQVGSPKGVARLMQRAGRSGHQPGAVSRVIGVPAHAFELIEFAAARDAAAARKVESREPVDRPLDVLAQHLVTCAMGGGFDPEAMYHEVRIAYSFRQLTEQEWRWCLDFVTRGGSALHAYPRYAKVVEHEGKMRVTNRHIARLHRMNIGTITSSTAISVQLQRGRTLGTVEEGFLSKIRPGDVFIFAGQHLELVRVRQMTAVVKRSKSRKRAVPTWQGGRSPLSSQLAEGVRAKLDAFLAGGAGRSFAAAGLEEGEEMGAVAPLLELQGRLSVVPPSDTLLIERVETIEEDITLYHHFLFVFGGRLVNEGLGALLAYRIAQREPITLSVIVNDYGLELLSETPLSLSIQIWRELLTTKNLLEDLLLCLNETELARRQFRDIARIAGLIMQGYPGEGRSARQLQASSELFYDVFVEFDPGNLLIDQARREVLDRQLEVNRLREALEKLRSMDLVQVEPGRLTPLSFPLWAESLREQHVTSEPWETRVMREAARLEAAAAGFGDQGPGIGSR